MKTSIETIDSSLLFDCEMMMIATGKSFSQLEKQYKSDISTHEQYLERNIDTDGNKLSQELRETYVEAIESFNIALKTVQKYIAFLNGEIDVAISENERCKGINYQRIPFSYHQAQIKEIITLNLSDSVKVIKKHFPSEYNKYKSLLKS
ncbi:hypothetical protein [Bacillus thuringiensis]|uniref:hypothetical protein n=1 Tax=Bacillus thuringiensis TaxID=1428 RepID=UPI000BF78CBA|nr:hypothetical protein [Bacillus thuringiensis]PEV64212.1 hypothetical protein CN434_25725 [Bacillus thuringiensis]